MNNPFLKDLIYRKTLDLKNFGCVVVIWCILGHVGLIGYDKANQSAKNKACKGEKLAEQ